MAHEPSLAGMVTDPRFAALSQGHDASQATPVKTRVAVPESCKGYFKPLDINTFMVELLESMQAYVSSKLAHSRVCPAEERDNLTNEIINTFTNYMLDVAPSRDNQQRWTLYNPVGPYSKVPYFKWFLTNLDFFRRDNERAIYRHLQNSMTLSEGDFEETFEKPANRAMNIDSVEQVVEYEMEVVENIANQQYALFLFDLGQQQPEGARTFEANAYPLYVAKMEGVSTSEIAAKFGISNSAVGQWSAKLKIVVRALMDGEGRDTVMALLQR